jgi:hypothetical protein
MPTTGDHARHGFTGAGYRETPLAANLVSLRRGDRDS